MRHATLKRSAAPGTLGWCCVAAAALLPQTAFADAYGQVDAAARIDSNVYRLPGGVSPGDGGRSDRIYTLGASGTLTATPGDFVLSADADASYDKYERYDRLDNFNYDLTARAERAPGARIGLAAVVESRRDLSGFATVNLPIRNVQQYTSASATVSLPITPELSIVATPDFAANVNSSDIFKPNDYHRYGGSLGLGYTSPLGNSATLSLGYRETKGLSPRLLVFGGATLNQPIDLSDTSVELRLRYAFSAITSVQANLSYVWRRDYTVLNRDRSSPFGEVTLDYHPRETFKALLTVGRQQETQDQLFVDSVRSSYVRASAALRVVDRLDVDLSGSLYDRRFAYDPLLVLTNQESLGVLARREQLYRVEAGADYAVWSRISVGARVAYEGRSSAVDAARYDAVIGQLSISFGFGNRPQIVAPRRRF